jgi:hypothetical protein
VLFNNAHTWRWIGSNPLDGVNKITSIRDQRDRYLDDSERKALLEIADMLGHKILQMVKRYAHLSGDHKRGLAERLSENIF